MDHEIEFAQKLESIDARCKSNTHRCTRDTVNPVYHALADLVGLYVVDV